MQTNQGEQRKHVLMTGQQYRESLEKRRPLNLYLGGKKVADPTKHPIIRPSINSVALTYDLAHAPEHKALMTAESSLDGQVINRFTHLHQSPADLVEKVTMQRMLGQRSGCCYQRCVGMDGINAVFSTTFEIDEKHGTEYHQRFRRFVERAQREDLTIDGAMTDVKGDRSKRPSEQADPDMYVRIKERRPEGIVISGAKAHQTGAINSHEHLLMPTVALGAEDEDYAVVCSVAVDEPSITYIYGRQSCDERKLDESPAGDVDSGNACFGGQEVLVIFNDTFIPWENVYMAGEYEFAGTLVERFAGYHRTSYTCKVGVGDVLIGCAQTIAEYNGVAKASHVKDKIVEMVHLNETIMGCGLASAAKGWRTKAGNYMIDLLMANVTKQNVTRFPYEIARLLQDVAGGLMVTMPSAHDLENPETQDLVLKYLAAAPGVSVMNRMKILRLIENLTLGRAAVGYLTESMHGAGSPQAQRIMIGRMANLPEKQKLAKALAKIQEQPVGLELARAVR